MNRDIFEYIYTFSSLSDMLALGLTCKSSWSIYKHMYDDLTRRYNPKLYRHQHDTLITIDRHFATHNNPHLVVAPPSYGKTFIGIEFIRVNQAPTKTSIVIVPPNIVCVWKLEYDKLCPNYKSRLIEHKMVLNILNHKKYIDSEGAILSGKIIICTSKIPPKVKGVSAVVIDECHHISNSILDDVLALNVPTLLLSATPFTRSFYINDIVTTSSWNNVRLYKPEVVSRIFIVDAYEDKVCKYIEDHRNSNICIVLPNTTLVIRWVDIVSKIIDRSYIHTFITGAATELSKFASQGGILITSVRLISNGKNLNNCEHMIILSSRFNSNKISVTDMYQLRCRVARSSSIYKTVYMYMLCLDVDVYIRLYMSRYNLNGYDVINRDNLSTIIAKLDGRLDQLSAADYIILFCKKFIDVPAETVISNPTLSIDEILDLITSYIFYLMIHDSIIIMDHPKYFRVLIKALNMHNAAKAVYVDDEITEHIGNHELSSYGYAYTADQYNIFLQKLSASARELFPPARSSNILISLDLLLRLLMDTNSNTAYDICDTIDSYDKLIVEHKTSKKNMIADMRYMYTMYIIIMCVPIIFMIIDIVMIATNHCSLLPASFGLFVLMYIGTLYCVRIYGIINDYQHKYLNSLHANPDV